MLNYLRIGGAALIALALLYGGWAANGWRIKATQADALKIELRNELQRRVKADADRLSLQVKLSEAEARIGTGVRIVTKTIKQYVQPNDLCNLSEPVAGQLQQLRRGVPPAPTKLVGAGATTGK